MDNFTYSYPVRIHFGKGIARDALGKELAETGNRILFAYGKGSIKKSGLYDRILSLLNEKGKEVVELSGIGANPLYEKVQEGARLCRNAQIDFILAAGGGSVVDCCKVIAAQACMEEDIWEYECQKRLVPKCFIPVGAVMTVFGTGAEQNNSGVITNLKANEKRSLRGAYPDFAILDIDCTRSLPLNLMIAGAFDTLSHCMETYFSLPDEICISDEINEAVMCNVIKNMRKIKKDPANDDAREELAWDSVMGMNGILKLGKRPAFQAHQIDHQLGAFTDCTHGLGLAVIQPAYYRVTYRKAIMKFARFARRVWEIQDEENEEKIALAGICALEDFVREMEMPSSLEQLGVDKGILEKVVQTTHIMDTSCERLSQEKIREILQKVFL